MAILHIVLFKLKPNVTPEQHADLKARGEAMVSQIPGLVRFQAGGVLASTAHRARGYDMGFLMEFDDEESLDGFGPHPAHGRLKEVFGQVADVDAPRVEGDGAEGGKLGVVVYDMVV